MDHPRRSLPSWLLVVLAVLGPVLLDVLFQDLFDAMVHGSGASGTTESNLAKLAFAIFAAALVAFVVTGGRWARSPGAARTFRWTSAIVSLALFVLTWVGMLAG